MLSNNPPSQIEFTRDISREISQFLLDNPSFVANEELACTAKLWLDRAKLCRADLEAERKGKTDPLRKQVEDINATYKPPREELDASTETIERRLGDFLKAKETERLNRIEEARKASESAEREAREAELREREAHIDAGMGVVVDTIAATVAADRAFEKFQKASRLAALAEREKVKVGGGLRRATSLRGVENLTVTDPSQAVDEMWTMNGLSEKFLEAVKTEARAFRKNYGHLPNGIESKTERDV